MGVCGVDGRMLIARAELHFWEEPPLSGETGSGAVFFTNCSLRCAYCQNSPLAAGQVGWETSIDRLAEICCELQAQGALNVNFVTPTHYSLNIREAVKQARERGLYLPIVWNTSGYERVETIEALSDTVNVYLTDFKYANSNLAQRYSHAPDYPKVALAAIEKMIETAGEPLYDDYQGQRRMIGGVIVRHLVLPGSVENSMHAVETLVHHFGSSIEYSLMNQYTPVLPEKVRQRYPELDASVSSADYETVLDFADSLGMDDYFWQDGPADKESFIPRWNGEGVVSQDVS